MTVSEPGGKPMPGLFHRIAIKKAFDASAGSADTGDLDEEIPF